MKTRGLIAMAAQLSIVAHAPDSAAVCQAIELSVARILRATWTDLSRLTGAPRLFEPISRKI